MLYHLHEFAQGAMTPFRLAAEASQHVFSNPYNPIAYTNAGRAFSAACHVFEHSTRPYGKPSFALRETTLPGGQRVAVREEVVLRKPFCQLKRFQRDCKRDDPRLLIVAPLSGHFATLLRGTVEAMLPDHDVYITDWRDARLVPLRDGELTLDDYVDYVVQFLRHLGPGTHVMAVCQPSVPVLAAVSLMADMKDPARPASMTLMGGPIDTRENPTIPNRLATERSIEWFEHAVITRVPVQYPGFMRRVYPGFLQLTGFMTMNLDRHVGAHLRLFRNMVRGDGDSAAQHRNFYEEYRAVMDLPADYYLQTVEVVFQKHLLPKGEWISRGRRIDPGAITKTALLTVEGELDDISGIGQTKAAHKLLRNLPAARKGHYEQKGVGHYGVFNGSKWRNEIAPRVKKFIREHS